MCYDSVWHLMHSCTIWQTNSQHNCNGSCWIWHMLRAQNCAICVNYSGYLIARRECCVSLLWIVRLGLFVQEMPLGQSHAESRPHFYQTRSVWSMDQGSNKKRSVVHNVVPTVTKFCVMWEGLSLPHDTKFGNCRGEIVDRIVIFIWSLIHGSSWSGLIKVGPGLLLNIKMVFPGMGIVKIRWLWDSFFFMIGIHAMIIHLYIEMVPRIQGAISI